MEDIETRIKELSDKNDRCLEGITKSREEWARHIQLSHFDGIIPTTCHRCMNFKQGILISEAAIPIRQKEIKDLQGGLNEGK